MTSDVSTFAHTVPSTPSTKLKIIGVLENAFRSTACFTIALDLMYINFDDVFINNDSDNIKRRLMAIYEYHLGSSFNYELVLLDACRRYGTCDIEYIYRQASRSSTVIDIIIAGIIDNKRR